MKRIIVLLTALLVLCGACAGVAEKNADEPVVYEGVWSSDRIEMVIERDDSAKGYDTDVYTVQIFWGSGALEMSEWLYKTVWYDDVSDALICEGQGLMQNIRLPENDSEVDTVETVYDDGSAKFYFNEEGKLIWENFKEEPGTLIAFERIEALNQSELFTDADFEAALELILNKFSGFDGCELHSLYFAGDEYSTPENTARLDEIAKVNGYNGMIVKVMLFLSDFHSPTDPASKTSLNIDQEYKDWQWWLGCSDGGEWMLINWGY
ncbi:MAG: hypothetical protein IJM56_03820 [Clostridia bacterium]|nr:hypothetical protein [Clostridia bacterium]